MRSCEYISEPIIYPSNAHDLDLCLETMVKGFREVIAGLTLTDLIDRFGEDLLGRRVV